MHFFHMLLQICCLFTLQSQRSSGGSHSSPVFLISAVLGPLVLQTVSCGGLSSGAAWRKGTELILVKCLEQKDFKGLPEFVKSCVLESEHLQKTTS